MSYTGQVTPGGPPAVRELADLTITKLSVGPMDNNAYLLRCHRTGEQLLIDAANEADRLLALAGDAGLATVVTTAPDLLLLDEPTNHISLALAEELEQALRTAPGAVVAASHDRWLRRGWSGPRLRVTADHRTVAG